MDNLINIISSCRNYNFHSHTEFCDGHATMRQMTSAAIESGLAHYGFSPHAPINCQSTCNMDKNSVAVYFDTFNKISKENSSRINLYLSMEIDYIDTDFGPHIDYFQRLPLDYRLASIHFVKSQDGIPIDCDGRFERFKQRLHDCFKDDLRYVVEKFYEQELEMLELGGFDILGHFDKIGHNASLADPNIENQNWYISLIDDVIEHAKSAKVIIELNTKAFEQHNRLFPSTRFLEKVIAAKLPVMVNSDAHYPDKINAGRQKAFEIIDVLKQ